MNTAGIRQVDATDSKCDFIVYSSSQATAGQRDAAAHIVATGLVYGLSIGEIEHDLAVTYGDADVSVCGDLLVVVIGV